MTARAVTRPALVACLTAAILPVAAQTLPTPEPGLWETEWRMSVNGQDLGALMRAAMATALRVMPAEQRAQAEQMMQSQAAVFGGKTPDCVTPAEAARVADPKLWLAEMQKDAPQCRYQPSKIGSSSVSFRGRCEDPDGFTGDITGEFTLVNARAWTGHWGGKGRMAGAEDLPGLKVGADGVVEFRASGGGRWQAAACGAVQPR